MDYLFALVDNICTYFGLYVIVLSYLSTVLWLFNITCHLEEKNWRKDKDELYATIGITLFCGCVLFTFSYTGFYNDLPFRSSLAFIFNIGFIVFSFHEWSEKFTLIKKRKLKYGYDNIYLFLYILVPLSMIGLMFI